MMGIIRVQLGPVAVVLARRATVVLVIKYHILKHFKDILVLSSKGLAFKGLSMEGLNEILPNKSGYY